MKGVENKCERLSVTQKVLTPPLVYVFKGFHKVVESGLC